MNHQIKCENLESGLLVKVMDSLSDRYKLNVFSEPELDQDE